MGSTVVHVRLPASYTSTDAKLPVDHACTQALARHRHGRLRRPRVVVRRVRLHDRRRSPLGVAAHYVHAAVGEGGGGEGVLPTWQVEVGLVCLV